MNLTIEGNDVKKAEELVNSIRDVAGFVQLTFGKSGDGFIIEALTNMYQSSDKTCRNDGIDNRIVLGYYKTREEGKTALDEFNKMFDNNYPETLENKTRHPLGGVLDTTAEGWRTYVLKDEYKKKERWRLSDIVGATEVLTTTPNIPYEDTKYSTLFKGGYHNSIGIDFGILENYATQEEAEAGHKKWVKVLESQPEKLDTYLPTDLNTKASFLGIDVSTFKRVNFPVQFSGIVQ